MNILKNHLAIVDGMLAALGLGVPEMDLSDAPSGELDLDSIFGEDHGAGTTTNSTPTESQATTTTVTPQATTPVEPVIKTKTGTVYKTLDDAVTGIEHKDALIVQLREQVQKATGQDPLKPTRRQDPQQVDYTQDPEKYLEDLASAVNKKDTKAYMDVQRKLVFDTLGPVTPTLIALSRANAERVVSESIPGFKGFLHSNEYAGLKDQAPLLADAISQAESNPQAGAQLPELYRVAYFATRGMTVPEIVQNAQTPTPVVSVPRPTVHSTASAPPPASASTRPAVNMSLESRDGRKSIIEQFEAQGGMDRKW